jgi:hypothetical protein
VRIDAIFTAVRTINGLPAEQRLVVRQQEIALLVAELEGYRHAGQLLPSGFHR